MRRFTWLMWLLGLWFCGGAPGSFGQQDASGPEKILLWPEGAPGARGREAADRPDLAIFLPPAKQATGTAVLICPGGGYRMLVIDPEGYRIAKWLNSLGVAGFVLKYRHGGDGYRYPAPLQDAQRAMSLIRGRAKEWGLDPQRIGVMGFSAGGHLASTLGTHFNKRVYEARDAVDRQSCRPDFMVLAYPVITMQEPFVHAGSRFHLLGPNPPPALVEELSNERQVTAETPPTFLAHASDDPKVPVQNSIRFYLALRQAGVPAELHVYETGGHGFANRVKPGNSWSWRERCRDWMRVRKLIPPEKTGTGIGGKPPGR